MWIKAIVDKIKSLGDLIYFKLENHIRGPNILKFTWSFKHKQYPDGRIGKYKVHFCVRCNQHVEGVDVFDTCTPIMLWITSMLLLVLLLVLNIQNQHVDYNNVFYQVQWYQTVFTESP